VDVSSCFKGEEDAAVIGGDGVEGCALLDGLI
jgi:hypothetical protein